MDLGQVRVVLLEAASRLLSALPERLGAYAMKRLQRMGVEVSLGSMVAEVAGDLVRLKGRQVIPSRTVAWTAGVKGDASVGAWGLSTGRSAQVAVQPTLQVADHPEVYVIGDAALVVEDGAPLVL